MRKNQKYTIYIFLLVFILFLMVISSLFSSVKLAESNYSPLNEGWNIEINDIVYENISLDEFIFPVVNKGDVLKMSCKLPTGNIVPNPILRIYTIHSDVEVRYNNRIIYQYGKDLRNQNKLLGYGYHFIHIPAFYASADIELVMHITEDDAFSNLTIPEICNSDTVLRDYIISNRVPLAINIFLIVFGILMLCVSIVFCVYDRKFFKLFCVGCFSLGIGCWSLCSFDLVILFTYDLQMKAYLEFGPLYISPLFVLLYFWKDKLVTRNRVIYMGYHILLFAQIIFITIAFLLQIFNIVHFPAALKIQHLILFGLCIGVISLTVHDYLQKQLRNKALMMGITAMLLIGLFDLIRFSMIKYFVASGESHYSSVLCIGALVFVISQLVDFALEIGEILLQGAKTQVLEQMAYVDEMTGVANRRRCEEIWDSLDKNESDYGIFAYDLNFLKKTNDTKGHAMGDLLIRSFAQCLSRVFEKHGTVGRIGGDEFVVFISDMKNINIQSLIKQLEDEIEKTNLENPDLNISTAYGFCSHREYPNYDSRTIYRTADSNMYENKIAMKAARIE